MADVKRAKREAVDVAVRNAWAIFFYALYNKEGYDTEALKRVWREIEDVSDSINKGYATISDMQRVLWEEAGARLK